MFSRLVPSLDCRVPVAGRTLTTDRSAAQRGLLAAHRRSGPKELHAHACVLVWLAFLNSLNSSLLRVAAK
jgi:hypothetical protein